MASGFAPTNELLFLACPSKGNQKEALLDLFEFPVQIPCASKIKQVLAAQRNLSGFIIDAPPFGSGQLARSKASYPLKQTLALILFLF